jgi:toxin ParE1/3/4
MKHYEVSFRPDAEADLAYLYDYIADEAGTAVAGDYIERIEAACLSLGTFPERGTRREDLGPGIRTMGFERRATIAFIVLDSEAVILRVFYGGQDFERVLRRQGGEP